MGVAEKMTSSVLGSRVHSARNYARNAHSELCRASLLACSACKAPCCARFTSNFVRCAHAIPNPMMSFCRQFFRSSRRVKMSFLYEKGRAATFLLLCAYRFKKGNASLDFEQDDYEIRRRRLLPFPFSSPGRQQVLRATSLLP